MSQASEIQLGGLQVRSLTIGRQVVFWRLDGALDPFRVRYRVLRSESASGPFEPVSGEFTNADHFVDVAAPNYNDNRTLHYLVRAWWVEDPTDTIDFGPVEQGDPPDLVTLELRSHITHLLQEFAGRRCWVLPVRTMGARCSCWNPRLQKSTRSGCRACFDTTFVGGYLSPVETWLQFDPDNKQRRPASMGPIQTSNTTARCADWPPLTPHSILVESENVRWRITKVTQTEHNRQAITQELEVASIPQGDIEYYVPLAADDETLRDMLSTPARNYKNAYDLNASQGDLSDVFHMYPGMQRL